MKITVINGTEQQGVTYRLKEIFLQEFGDTAVERRILSGTSDTVIEDVAA